jgi:hypothetical protein
MFRKLLAVAIFLGAFLFIADRVVEMTTGIGIFTRWGY